MKNNKWLLIVIVFSLLPLLPLLHQGLPITHDGRDHVARIANFFLNLQQGIIIPRWAGNLNWGYGHPVLMFLYPLPSYMASFFHIFGFSFIDSTKLVFASAYVLSGVTMYLWLSSFLKRESAFLGSTLYLFASYRFVDLFVRGAIGEHVAFIFPPLICYFLYQLVKSRRSVYALWSGIAIAGLILAHDAISIMFLPFIVLYAACLIAFTAKKKRLLIECFLCVVLGFLLSAFFWIPAFFEGKYTLRDIVSSRDFSNSFFSLEKFIYSPWDFGISGQFSMQIGVIPWLFVIFTFIGLVFYRKKIKKQTQLFLTLLFLFFLGSLLLMLPISRIVWDSITLIQKFQFPWRFLSVAVFSTAVIGAIGTDLLPKDFRKITIGIALITILSTIPYWGTHGYFWQSDSFFSGIYSGTTDTGESSPLWSVRFMEESPRSHLEYINGQGTYRELSYIMDRHRYTVDVQTDATLRENTVYFPGWKVLVDGIQVGIEFQDPHNRGVLVFPVSKGSHVIDVEFHETKLRLFSDSLSLVALLITLFSFILIRTPLWKRFQ